MMMDQIGPKSFCLPEICSGDMKLETMSIQVIYKGHRVDDITKQLSVEMPKS
jgi:hypothetical protein